MGLHDQEKTLMDQKDKKQDSLQRGFSQTKGLDCQETFSPTANITSVRMLMQMVVQYDLTVHHMDITSAYLRAPIDCEFFVEQPEGFETKTDLIDLSIG